jgi:hypothetical protein
VTDKLQKPEFEAEIYYLTEKEGGKKNPIHSGYRGQFHYGERDWDAPQEFIDKEICNPGESVKVRMQTMSPDYQIGHLYIGKKFEIREGAKIVGKGKITKILRQDFNYWDFDTILKTLDSKIKPYDGDNLTGFKIDFDSHLSTLQNVQSVEIVETGQLDCMVVIFVKLDNKYNTPRFVTDRIIDCWKSNLALSNQLFKVTIDTKMIGDKHLVNRFVLTFVTWSSIFLTGQIIIEE